MTGARLLWHLIASPLAGALIASGLYVTFLQPLLPGPGWALDATAALCGTVGLLAGGILGFRLSPVDRSPETPRSTSSSVRRVTTFTFSTIALWVAFLLSGIPAMNWPMALAAIAGGTAAALISIRR